MHFLKRDTELFWGLEKFKLLLQELFPVGGDEFKRGVLRVTGLKLLVTGGSETAITSKQFMMRLRLRIY